MKRFQKLFKQKMTVIGMIHLDPLPGTPKYAGNIQKIIEKALQEAEIYQKSGIHALAIENMHDLPYLKKNIGPEITALMSIIGHEIKKMTNLPCGIQILAGANKEALAVAKSASLDFIRAEGFIFGHLGDEGYIDSCAGELLRYRKQIEADDILIFTDIKKKHSAHALTADVSISETAKAAEFFLSDGVIITGVSTGSSADPLEINEVKNKVRIPVLVGSGVTAENLEKYLEISDALIVGSYFKKNGYWENELMPETIKKFMDKVNNLSG